MCRFEISFHYYHNGIVSETEVSRVSIEYFELNTFFSVNYAQSVGF